MSLLCSAGSLALAVGTHLSRERRVQHLHSLRVVKATLAPGSPAFVAAEREIGEIEGSIWPHAPAAAAAAGLPAPATADAAVALARNRVWLGVLIWALLLLALGPERGPDLLLGFLVGPAERAAHGLPHHHLEDHAGLLRNSIWLVAALNVPWTARAGAQKLAGRVPVHAAALLGATAGAVGSGAATYLLIAWADHLWTLA